MTAGMRRGTCSKAQKVSSGRGRRAMVPLLYQRSKKNLWLKSFYPPWMPLIEEVLHMFLPALPLQRLINMLAYQFEAMAADVSVEEEPLEQFHHTMRSR